MEKGALKIVKISPRKFVVEIPGGGHSGEMGEAEARGWVTGFMRAVGWSKAQIREPDGIEWPS